MASRLLADHLPPEALRLLQHADRATTPCGEGDLVWHAWGDTGGEPLVLLHGGSGSWTHWVRNIETLAAAGRRVVVPDLPGFGDSALPPGNHDADGVVPVLAAGLPHLVGMRAVDVVGFSFGGLCGGLLAAAHPELVRHLVIVGAPGLGLRATRLPLVGWRHLHDPEARLAAHRFNLGTLMLHRPESIDELAVALQAANVPLDRLRRRRLALSDILRRTLPGLQCRFDAIYGEQDALYADRLDELAAVLKTAPTLRELVLLPGAGHWAQYEDPAAFDAALLRVLASAP